MSKLSPFREEELLSELERRRKAKKKAVADDMLSPVKVTDELREAVKDYVRFQVGEYDRGLRILDLEEMVVDSAVGMFYGPEIWEKIRALERLY